MGRSLEQSRVELTALQARAVQMRQSLDTACASGSSVLSRTGALALPLTTSDLLDGDVARHLAGTTHTKPVTEQQLGGTTTAEVSLVVSDRAGGKLHAIAIGELDIPPSLWSTHCGWPFGRERAQARRTVDWFAAPMCSGCFDVKQPRKATTTISAADAAATSGSSSEERADDEAVEDIAAC
jgi:hypothetical protein